MKSRLLAVVLMGVVATMNAVAVNVDFAAKRMLTGKAKVAETGYVVS